MFLWLVVARTLSFNIVSHNSVAYVCKAVKSNLTPRCAEEVVSPIHAYSMFVITRALLCCGLILYHMRPIVPFPPAREIEMKI